MREIAENMRVSGALLFRDALIDTLSVNGRRSVQCIIHLAQAAEILIKARIADEHPLLIFSKIPEPKGDDEKLSLDLLLEKGRTFSYDELPDRLWAVTGIKISNVKKYRDFGKLRNQLIHLSFYKQENLAPIAMEYIFDILDPLIEKFWGYSVIDFIEHDFIEKERINDILIPWEYEGLWRKQNDFLMNNFRIYPKMRRLLGEKASQDWEGYEMDLERHRTTLEEQLNYEEELRQINIHANHDINELDISDIEEKMFDQHEAEWQSFLQKFKSA
jgi:hypothetical protein